MTCCDNIFLFVVEEVKKAWKNLRDPFCKRELDKQTKGDTPAGGKQKSGAAGGTVAEAVSRWKYYEQMSFYKPFIYDRP